MTHDQPHPEHDPRAHFEALLNEDPINLAALLRACADGELDKDQCDRLAEFLGHQPSSRSQVEFERALRSCCGRVMTGPCCPDAVRSRVTAQITAQTTARANDQTDAQTTVDGSGGSAASINEQSIKDLIENPMGEQVPLGGAYTRERSFWARSPVLGIAAVLLLTFAGVLIWQSVSFSKNAVPVAGLNMDQAAYYNRVSDFVVREHNRCCQERAAQAKLVRHDVGQAVAYFSEQFGHPVSVPDMTKASGEVRFYGGGDCQLPSTVQSAHLRFDAIDAKGNTIALSLFIAPDPGLLPLEEGKTYLLRARACSDAGARLFAWVSDGLQYLLISEAPDEMCSQVRQVMNAPTMLGSI